MGNLRVHLLKDTLAFFSLFHQSDGCTYEQIRCTCSDFEERDTNYRVEKPPSGTEKWCQAGAGTSEFQERFVLILGHRAVAHCKGYLLLFMGVWNVYYTQAGNPQTLNKFSKGRHRKTLCWIIACFIYTV